MTANMATLEVIDTMDAKTYHRAMRRLMRVLNDATMIPQGIADGTCNTAIDSPERREDGAQGRTGQKRPRGRMRRERPHKARGGLLGLSLDSATGLGVSRVKGVNG